MNRRVSFLSILLALAMRMLRRRTAASLFGLLLISGSIAAVPAIPVVSWAGAGMTVSGRISNKNDEPQKGYVVNYACTRSASDDTSVGGGSSAVTGADGKFEIVNVPAGDCPGGLRNQTMKNPL